MKTSEKVLQLLLKKQAFLSGQELADELNVSRTAVWKAIQSLQEEGYQIESKPRIGYRYIEGLKLSEASIRRFLNPELDLNFEIYDTIDSTNNRCSQKAMDPETKTPLVVISDSQKAGHGRYGRPFASPVGGGIYISILLDNDDPDFNPGLLTTATAIAVTRTIEKLVHARCEIKWVNDILVDGKKIVGILTEGVADLETQLIKHIIVGTYCGYTYQLPKSCPACEGTELVNRGFGTEKIEDDIKILFPEAAVARMDLDTTRTRSAYEKIIADFEQGKTDILIGTQMVSKGLDFDHVSIVGILNADTMLNYPDFRSYERAFQLMAQVAGRAGRKNKRGRVVLQTKSIDHPIIHQVIANDYEDTG